MEICRQDQALEIRELDPFLAELLQAGPGKRAAKRFSSGGRASFQCARGARGKGFVCRVESLRRSGTAASFSIGHGNGAAGFGTVAMHG